MLSTSQGKRLCHDSERYSTREFTRTAVQLIELVGGCRNSHAKARAELVKEGLVFVHSLGQDGFKFHLCDPETGKPWPYSPKTKLTKAHKAAPLPPGASEHDAPVLEMPAKVAKPQPKDEADYRPAQAPRPAMAQNADQSFTETETSMNEELDPSFNFGCNSPVEIYSAPRKELTNFAFTWADLEQQDSSWRRNS